MEEITHNPKKASTKPQWMNETKYIIHEFVCMLYA